MDLRSVSVPSEGSKRPLSDIIEDKANLGAYYIRPWRLGYGSDWYDVRVSQAAYINTNNKPYNAMPVFANNTDYPSSIPGIAVMKSVNEPFFDVVDYQN